MRSKFLSISWFAAAVICLMMLTNLDSALCQTSPSGRTGLPSNLYIAPFTSHDPINTEILASFRDLFEESFERSAARGGTYRVLNRQTIEKILAEAKSEATLTSVDQLNAVARGRLRIVHADGVVFGEVTDDKDSGDIIIAAKLQSFDSVLYWNESVTMRRGHIHDRSDRKDAMEQLVRSIKASSEVAADTGEFSHLPEMPNHGEASPKIDGPSINLAVTKVGLVGSWRAQGGKPFMLNGRDAIEIPYNPRFDLPNGSSWTLEAWVFPIENPRGMHVVGKRGFCNTGDGFYQIAIDRNAPGTGMSVDPSDVPLYAWTHVAIAASSTGWTSYVNGSAVKTVSAPGFRIQNNSGLLIGGSGLGCPRFKGAIDQISLYARALSEAEVSATYTSQRSQIMSEQVQH